MPVVLVAWAGDIAKLRTVVVDASGDSLKARVALAWQTSSSRVVVVDSTGTAIANAPEYALVTAATSGTAPSLRDSIRVAFNTAWIGRAYAVNESSPIATWVYFATRPPAGVQAPNRIDSVRIGG